MLSFDFRQPLRAFFAIALLGAAAIASGCTVQPLYGNAYSSTSTAAKVRNIEVSPVATREAQEVRNHLIFLFSGGQGTPPDPAYRMDILVSTGSTPAAIIQSGTAEQSPTSSLLTMRADYSVRDNTTGQVVASGKRQIASAYDVPAQQFAALRALRDAEDRAARELAQLLQLAVAQQLATGG